MNRLRATAYRLQANAGGKESFTLSLRTPHSALRAGFTLVELLVVVSIIGILAVMTFTAYTRTADGDRVPSAARQLQSYLEGARDRAIHAHEPRGVRLQLDPETPGLGVPQTVSSMVFIGAPGSYNTGTITIDDMTVPPTVAPTMGSGGDWDNLWNRGLLTTTPRLRLIINDTTSEYLHIAKESGSMPPIWHLTKTPTVAYTPMTAYDYELELLPAVLPNQEPRLLAREVVIDLSKCVIPDAWGNVNVFSNKMDIMFSPRGTIVGDVTSAGLVHFFIGDTPDVKQGRAGIVLNPTMGAPPTDYVDIDVYDTSGTSTLDTDYSAANAGQYQVILRSKGSYGWYLRQLDFVEPSPGLGMTDPAPVGTSLYRVWFSPPIPANTTPVAARIELLPELKRGDERIVTLTPQTGNISTYEPGADGADLFTFAKVGAVAR